jgi:hypothetical protein
MKWIIRFYGICLLIYTGMRTFWFIRDQLPTGDASTILALVFLLATELGMLLWHEMSLRHTTTEVQQNIATVMTWLDFAGSTLAGTADMIIRQHFLTGYQLPGWLGLVVLYGLPCLMAVNVASTLIYTSNDSDALLERADRRLEHEENRLEIEARRQALRELHANRAAIAERLQPHYYKQIHDRVTGRTLARFEKQAKSEAPVEFGRNGHKENLFAAEVDQVRTGSKND